MIRGKGFVLSFAVLTLSLFILIFAQIQAGHLFKLRFSEADISLRTIPLRFASDARTDLNALLDQRVRVDQNASAVEAYVQGALPSSINVSASLLRYQTNLVTLGRDFNVVVSMDLNAVVNEGNVTGRLSNGFVWKRPFTGMRVSFEPTSASFIPRGYDINVDASLAYTSTSAWSLAGSGDVYITLRYVDQNTGHTFTSAGWITAAAAPVQYTFTYAGGSSSLRVQVGRLDDNSGSVFIDNNAPSSLSVGYSVRALFDANGTTPTWAGYDIPLSIVGPDANVVASSTQWLTN